MHSPSLHCQVVIYGSSHASPHRRLDNRHCCMQITEAAEQLVAALHSSKSFTDTANFTLRCGVCNCGLKGEKEAVEHAKQTGHQNFSEY